MFLNRFLTAPLVGAVFVCAVLSGCDPEQQDSKLSVRVSPREIAADGSAATVTLTAVNAQGMPGSGNVTLSAGAGAFATTSVPLSNGEAETTFSCDAASDAKCTGTIRVTAEWDGVTAVTSVVVGGGNTGLDDAGTDAGADAGTDGGQTGSDGGTDGGFEAVVDAGADAGQGFDAGSDALHVVMLKSSRQALVANTGDEAVVTAAVTLRSTGAALADVPVTFTTDRGSFEEMSQASTVTVMTDATGNASATLSVFNVSPGKATVRADTGEGLGEIAVPFLSVASIIYSPTAATKPLLGIASSGRDTTTPITFQVLDANQQPVPGMDVSFEVSGAAGATVTPNAATNAQGLVSTTLQSGNTVGVAIVRAVVTATKGQTPEISAGHPGTPIVGGKPSDRGLSLSCTQYNLGALHWNNPPRPNVTTNCEAKLVDRFSNPVGLTTSVQFYSEAGAISSPVDSTKQTGTTPSATTGVAKTVFNATGAFPPYDTTPMAAQGEPSDNNRNPRDMLVTIIAVVAGEEDFYDGSGSTGVTNGRWDPGEWFVDLPEPFIDQNDNGKWDPGEVFFDTERGDCANPGAPKVQNGKWDPPNGCWDPDTQIFRSTHIVYSGQLDPSHLLLSPPVPAGGYYVPVGSQVSVGFLWGDSYFNALSPNSASIGVTKTGARGSVSVSSSANSLHFGGFDLTYSTVEVTQTLPDGGVGVDPGGSWTYTRNGNCNVGAATPGGTPTSGAVHTRCIRVGDFNFVPGAGGTSGSVKLTGATTPQAALSDGGVPAPQSSIVNITAKHAYSAESVVSFPAQFE